MDEERPYGEPEYDRLSERIVRLKRELAEQLGQAGKDELEQLTEAYLKQSNILMRDTFYDGFCCAADLMLDYLKWQSHTEHSLTADQQHPPEP